MPLRTLPFDRPLDLGLTLGILRHGLGDPTVAFSPGSVARATRTAEGPATLLLRITGRDLVAEAWGPGADAALEDVPALVGWWDDPAALVPAHPLISELARRRPGLRIGRTGSVMDSLVPAILEQKVTGSEAFAAYRSLVRRFGQPAPGPLGLWLAPEAPTLAALPYHAFHPLGVERRRADTIRLAALRATRVEETATMPLEAAYRRLTALPGVGAWTAGEVGLRAFGDPDAVSVGDYHLPSLVTWLLTGEAVDDDARMLEVLEPYRGQRGRVIRLLETSGIRPARRGPRMAPRAIAGI
jgi:3-methyladenine DNA glycosylase/8-oxoguanine DNA glycosylase